MPLRYVFNVDEELSLGWLEAETPRTMDAPFSAFLAAAEKEAREAHGQSLRQGARVGQANENPALMSNPGAGIIARPTESRDTKVHP